MEAIELQQSVPNGSSPAEALMNRKVRLPMETIHPSTHHSHKSNVVMEQESNHQHGVVERTDKTGKPVLRTTGMAQKNEHNEILCVAPEISSTKWTYNFPSVFNMQISYEPHMSQRQKYNMLPSK